MRARTKRATLSPPEARDGARVTAALGLAAHVGIFVAADRLDSGLLAICLAAGSRGEHRVVVLDPARRHAQVAAFPVPSRARSGITPVLAAGELLVTGDDHELRAVRAATGELVWSRSFPAPQSSRLHAASRGRLLVSTLSGSTPETRLLRADDGADDATLEGVNVAGCFAACLGPNGEVGLPFIRSVHVARAGATPDVIPLVSKRRARRARRARH